MFIKKSMNKKGWIRIVEAKRHLSVSFINFPLNTEKRFFSVPPMKSQASTRIK